MNKDFDDIRRLAADIRIQTIRQMETFGAGHIGGCMSVADVLAVLYGRIMRFDSNEPNMENRDKLVMSKGHCGPALYATLALRGFFPMEWLDTLNQGGTRLPSHCDRNKTPGIDASTGSLGQGISIACGFAQANAMKKLDIMTYCIVGDGEMQEGQVWEAIEFAAHRKLDHLVVLVDNNKMQLDGYVEDICKTYSISKKLEAFGFETDEVAGYDVEAIYRALEKMKQERNNSIPKALILNTKKGIGCTFAEVAPKCHHMTVSKDEADNAIAEIERRLAEGLTPGGEKYAD